MYHIVGIISTIYARRSEVVFNRVSLLQLRDCRFWYDFPYSDLTLFFL
ncbi:LOW QUALITY PROTEIN: hypothetical protein PanWU01x14_147280 [Parasponia andersonii]|uniref:Uncharacterized protein n=1 Tax=Parasponia andersonii TaxID=3476 RepID=A0A2P5CJY2_PARAD|nr:LOW QUALITY PROTEIN: hypothetical protein PanWU01x14_147280 [Parasponia andersonii]